MTRQIAWLLALLALPLAAAERRVIGMAADYSTPLEALVQESRTGTGGVMLIGGLDGSQDSAAVVRAQMEQRGGPALGLPMANPRRSRMVFPPTGVPYRENIESHALWTWIGIQAPDLVLIVGEDPGGLAAALGTNPVAGVGKIPALHVAPEDIAGTIARPIPPSEAHLEMDRRRSRTPRELANELSQYYGHDFNQLTYIPGMALIAQTRLGNWPEVEQLAAPYLDPARDTLNRASSLTLAGHLVFARLAQRSGDARYVNLVRKAADLGFDSAGQMLASMPFHGEMSDSYFMAGPITAMAGTLTGERKYFDMVARHFRYMDKLVLRPDGLVRHSPLTDAAWGRGNAFAALGLALALNEFPPNHPDYGYVRDSYRRLMAVLARHQDAEGLWHEIIDEPGAWAETSATAMIGIAMLKGVRRGWIEPREYSPRVDRAWQAVVARVAPLGQIWDVCESTNKMPSREDYLRRTALRGQDPRGGAMVLLFATEMAGLE